MSIENNLKRIADSLEKLAAGAVDLGVVVSAAESVTEPEATKAEAPAAAATESSSEPEAPSPPSPEAPTVTRDMVREALRIFRKDHSKEDAVAVLAKFEAKSITAADESVLPKLLEAFAA